MSSFFHSLPDILQSEKFNYKFNSRFHTKRTKRAAKIVTPQYAVRIMSYATLAHPSGLIALCTGCATGIWLSFFPFFLLKTFFIRETVTEKAKIKS